MCSISWNKGWVMNIIAKTIIASAIATFGGAANAAVIGFDEITGGGPNSTYTESGFTFSPAGSTGDIKCWDTKCLKEVTQTVGTTMTYDAEPDETLDSYSLDFFYFAAVGNTTTENNSFVVQGLDSDENVLYSAEFVIGEKFASVDFDDAASSSAFLSFAKDIGGDPADPTVINYNVGYWVDLTGWLDIYYTNWFINTADGPTDGQWRLDCVGANEPDTSGANSGCEPAAPVPLPAAGWLLISALGGLGLAARRRRKAS